MRSTSACRLLLIGTSIRRKRPPTGTAGLARVLVSGQRRLPWPPPSTAVTTSRRAPGLLMAPHVIATRHPHPERQRRMRPPAPHGMPNVQFVLPFPAPIADRFLTAVTALPGVRVGVVSQEPLERISPAVARRLAGHWRVGSCFDPQQLAEGVRG